MADTGHQLASHPAKAAILLPTKHVAMTTMDASNGHTAIAERRLAATPVPTAAMAGAAADPAHE
jgi:hypothetical protein